MRPSTSLPARAALLVGLFAIIAGAAACSDEPDPAAAPPTLPRATQDQPASTGDVCNDPTGDIANDASSNAAGTMSEPAGIDLVRAETRIEGDQLRVTATVVAPWSTATQPAFFIMQGDPQVQAALTWELRFTSEKGPWTILLVKYPTAQGQRQTDTPLTAPVKVTDNQLEALIPLGDLPVIATTQWLFGTTSGVSDNNRVFDDCVPFQQSGTDTTGGSAPAGTTPSGSVPSSAVTPTSAVTGSVNQPVVAQDGARITVRTIDDPALPNRTVTEAPFPTAHLAAIEVEVCATTRQLERVGERRFSVELADGATQDVWDAPDHTNDPRFTAERTLRSGSPGECAEGWITFAVPNTSEIAKVIYDTSGTGAGPFTTILR